MQNNTIKANALKDFPCSIKIITFVLFVFILLITSSLFLILACSTFVLILLLLLNYNVKFCLESVRKNKFVLIFVILFYIITSGVTVNLLLILYKCVLLLIYFNILAHTTTFFSLNSGLNNLLFPLKKFGINVFELSYNISLTFHFLKILKEKSNKIKKSGDKNVNMLSKKLSKILISLQETNQYSSDLDLKFYNKKKIEQIDVASIAVLFIFLLIFIILIIREVIL